MVLGFIVTLVVWLHDPYWSRSHRSRKTHGDSHTLTHTFSIAPLFSLRLSSYHLNPSLPPHPLRQVSGLKFQEDRSTGRSKGCVLVEFVEPEAAAACKEQLTGWGRWELFGWRRVRGAVTFVVRMCKERLMGWALSGVSVAGGCGVL